MFFFKKDPPLPQIQKPPFQIPWEHFRRFPSKDEKDLVKKSLNFKE